MTKNKQFTEANTTICEVLNKTVNDGLDLQYTQAAAVYVLRRINNYDKKEANKWLREHAPNFCASSGVLCRATTVADEFFTNLNGVVVYKKEASAADNIDAVAKFMQTHKLNYKTSKHAAELKRNAEKRAAEKVEAEKTKQAEAAKNAEAVAAAIEEKPEAVALDLIVKFFGERLNAEKLERIAQTFTLEAQRRAEAEAAEAAEKLEKINERMKQAEAEAAEAEKQAEKIRAEAAEAAKRAEAADAELKRRAEAGLLTNAALDYAKRRAA